MYLLLGIEDLLEEVYICRVQWWKECFAVLLEEIVEFLLSSEPLFKFMDVDCNYSGVLVHLRSLSKYFTINL